VTKWKVVPAWSKYSCGAAIVIEKASEAAAHRDAIVPNLAAWLRNIQFIIFPLVVSFAVIVSGKFRQCARERPLAEKDQLG